MQPPSIDNLVDRQHLADLYMMGNPCEQDWPGFKSYVIARLPQVKQLDGTEVTRAMRISALQQLPALVAELRVLAEERRGRRSVEEREKEEERARKEEKARRKAARAEAMEEGGADGAVVVEDVSDSEEEDEDELTGHTPEVREEIYREMAEEKLEKDKREKENQPKWRGEKEFEAEQKASVEKAREREERGQIRQCNEGKWRFRFDEESKPGHVLLDLSVQKHLSSSLIDVDVHPSYISVVIKSKVLRLILPADVESSTAKAERSKTTGHLLVTMKKVDENENMVALRAARKAREAEEREEGRRREEESRRREGAKLGAQILEAVDLRITREGKKAGAGAEGGAGAAMKALKTVVKEPPPPPPPPPQAAAQGDGLGGKKRVVMVEEDSEASSDDDDEPPPIF